MTGPMRNGPKRPWVSSLSLLDVVFLSSPDRRMRFDRFGRRRRGWRQRAASRVGAAAVSRMRWRGGRRRRKRSARRGCWRRGRSGIRRRTTAEAGSHVGWCGRRLRGGSHPAARSPGGVVPAERPGRASGGASCPSAVGPPGLRQGPVRFVTSSSRGGRVAAEGSGAPTAQKMLDPEPTTPPTAPASLLRPGQR